MARSVKVSAKSGMTVGNLIVPVPTETVRTCVKPARNFVKIDGNCARTVVTSDKIGAVATVVVMPIVAVNIVDLRDTAIVQ